ncbi:hypothetical protein BOTBODRAFT_28083 [Botryobasidium botryosum FD-172 SS1]|uniref:Fungal lipase-type domain-containing protein n=1 Tax=Botryobasidium botryosum (strain FD-172 SS1) TaxID=930990 RepID=A0A067N6U9_BOTB1|nr:hypothetical protein BOTBODRAFT_28083 [Botryobasidium botryosum FD-172 SS1]
MAKSLFFSLILAAAASAAPSAHTRSGVTTMSGSQVSSYTPYAEFSRAAYCSGTDTWNCGAACEALSGFVPYLTGGDGDGTPHFYVGYWPSGDTAVIVHEGTDPTKLLSDLTDEDFLLTDLDPTLFPGLSAIGIQAHNGFHGTQAVTAPAILAAVKQIISERHVSTVTCVGHSLGGAIALLDGMFMRIQLPSSIHVKVVTHGMPRVGNQDLANWVDENITDLAHITNMHDVVPIVPGRGLGFHHPSNEKHILSGDDWVACSGQDNTDPSCIVGAVPNLLAGNVIDHLGPYHGVMMGTLSC